MGDRDDRIEVTDENFGDLLIEGLEEAVAVERGDLQPVRVSRYKLTARHTAVREPPRYDGRRVVALRERLGLSQPVFARVLNVSASTVRAWEQGQNEPSGSARRLLEVAEEHPEAVIGTIAVGELDRTRLDVAPGDAD